MTSPPLPASHTMVANGLVQHVLEWPRAAPSPAAGPATVVLVHGFMDAAGTWDLVAPTLAGAGFRVLAPDMRGFGAGPRAPSGSYYHFVDYVFDVADVVEHLCPGETVAVVGHSMGGTIATMFAGTFPERVSRLASLEGLGPPDLGFEAGPVRMRAWIEQVRAGRARGEARPTFTYEQAMDRLAMSHPAVDRGLLATRLAHLAEEVAPGRFAWRFDALHRTTSPMPFFAQLLCAYARKVTCPVLFVSGGPTGFHPPDEDARLAAFAQVRSIELDGAGHMMHWTRPDALAGALLAFLV